MSQLLSYKRVISSLAAASCLVFSLLTSVLAQAPAPVPAASVPLPDFTLRSLTGENLRLSEFRGNVVLLGFWARWCGDCRQAMQALNEVHAKYERAGLVTLGINLGDTPDQAESMAKSLGLAYPVLLDTNKIAGSQFDINAMPLILLIDREGKVRFSHPGFERGQDQKITEHLRQLLNE